MEVEARRQHVGPARAGGGVEQGEGPFPAQRDGAGAAQAGEVGLGESRRHAAGVGPKAPGHRQRAGPAATGGEGVAERVRRRVAGLAGAAEEGGRGGEHDEHAHREVRRGGVQVGRPGGLRRPGSGQFLRGQGGDHGVPEPAGGVDDSGQRVGGLDRGDEVAHRVRVGDV